MNYTKDIRDFIVSNFLFGDTNSLKDDSSFLASGILDSTAMLELVTFIEEKYRIKILDHEMVPENLDSVIRLNRLVVDKLAGQELVMI